jgi:signal transduction histidine kinase
VPAVLGDEGKLVQAVMNAVLNAGHVLRSHPPVGDACITITTRSVARGEVEIEVRDNGPGFPTELIPTLGQPFVTTRATEGGSGLGIFVIRGIVDAHGGTVALENAAEGGAVLRIRLPVRREPQGTIAVASISTSAPGSMSDETSTAVMAG